MGGRALQGRTADDLIQQQAPSSSWQVHQWSYPPRQAFNKLSAVLKTEHYIHCHLALIRAKRQEQQMLPTEQRSAQQAWEVCCCVGP
jgi:L-ascorbate metabolism protein UlaG (beta-lactamase superfamily)